MRALGILFSLLIVGVAAQLTQANEGGVELKENLMQLEKMQTSGTTSDSRFQSEVGLFDSTTAEGNIAAPIQPAQTGGQAVAE